MSASMLLVAALAWAVGGSATGIWAVRRREQRGFPAHLRSVTPGSGEVAPMPHRSPYVLGRPRSRGPGIRLWRNIDTLPTGFRFAIGADFCDKMPHSGKHRRPLSGLIVPAEDEPVAPSPYVLGRPRQRVPSVRLWRSLETLPVGFWLSTGDCYSRPGIGRHRRPFNQRMHHDDCDGTRATCKVCPE